MTGRSTRRGAQRIVVPTEDLADEIAGEWRGQTGDVMPETMPITRLVTTAIDRVAERRAEIIDDLASFGASDLVCYPRRYANGAGGRFRCVTGSRWLTGPGGAMARPWP